jgi:hypothetical protein
MFCRSNGLPKDIITIIIIIVIIITITAAKVSEELNQASENSDTKKEDIQCTKAILGESLQKKWEKRNNAWPVY